MPIVDITIYQARGTKEPNNQKWDRLLDENIDEICEMIISGKPFKAIAEHFGVKSYYWWTWRKKTIHKDILEASIEASAHTLEQAARDVLVEGIVSGTQNMAEANLRRELAKALQFAASKRNQAFYGNKKDEGVVPEQPKVENEQDYKYILEQLKQRKAMGSAPVKEEEKVFVKRDGDEKNGFTEYEEVK